MKYILFLNKCWGVDFVLGKRMKAEDIEFDYVSLFEGDLIKNKKLYKKYGIRTTPVLLMLDNGDISDKLVTVNEIVEELKKLKENEQNIEISLGGEA